MSNIKRIIITILLMISVLFTALLMSGCGNSLENKLISHPWTETFDGGTETLEFRSDGTYSSHTSFIDGDFDEYTGEWKIENNNVLKWRQDDWRADHWYSYKFYELDDNKIAEGSVSLSDSSWYVSNNYFFRGSIGPYTTK